MAIASPIAGSALPERTTSWPRTSPAARTPCTASAWRRGPGRVETEDEAIFCSLEPGASFRRHQRRRLAVRLRRAAGIQPVTPHGLIAGDFGDQRRRRGRAPGRDRPAPLLPPPLRLQWLSLHPGRRRLDQRAGHAAGGPRLPAAGRELSPSGRMLDSPATTTTSMGWDGAAQMAADEGLRSSSCGLAPSFMAACGSIRLQTPTSSPPSRSAIAPPPSTAPITTRSFMTTLKPGETLSGQVRFLVESQIADQPVRTRLCVGLRARRVTGLAGGGSSPGLCRHHGPASRIPLRSGQWASAAPTQWTRTSAASSRRAAAASHRRDALWPVAAGRRLQPSSGLLVAQSARTPPWATGSMDGRVDPRGRYLAGTIDATQGRRRRGLSSLRSAGLAPITDPA